MGFLSWILSLYFLAYFLLLVLMEFDLVGREEEIGLASRVYGVKGRERRNKASLRCLKDEGGCFLYYRTLFYDGHFHKASSGFTLATNSFTFPLCGIGTPLRGFGRN